MGAKKAYVDAGCLILVKINSIEPQNIEQGIMNVEVKKPSSISLFN
jgi:hypothetical protein